MIMCINDHSFLSATRTAKLIIIFKFMHALQCLHSYFCLQHYHFIHSSQSLRRPLTLKKTDLLSPLRRNLSEGWGLLSDYQPIKALVFSRNPPRFSRTTKSLPNTGQAWTWNKFQCMACERAPVSHSEFKAALFRILRRSENHATSLDSTSCLRELEIHQRLRSLSSEESENTRHCNRLITHFKHPGIER